MAANSQQRMVGMFTAGYRGYSSPVAGAQTVINNFDQRQYTGTTETTNNNSINSNRRVQDILSNLSMTEALAS